MPRHLTLLVVAVVLVGLNLRGAIVSLPPLLDDISADLGLSAPAAGLLTSVPLLCFAAASPLVALAARRFGVEPVLLVSLVLLTVATAVRPWGSFGLLLTGTVAVGVAIAAGNVLVPVIVRRESGPRTSGVMGLATASYGLGAALAAGLAVPLALALGWRGGAAVTAVAAAVATVVWVMWMRAAGARDWAAGHGRADGAAVPVLVSPRAVWREPDAWWLAGFFGLQSILFYSVSTWFPSLLVDRASVSLEQSGTALSVFQGFGIAGMLAAPVLLRLLRRGPVVCLVSCTGWVVFFVGLGVVPHWWLALAVVGGLAQGLGISIALTLVAVRPVDVDYGRGLSAFVQTAGYSMAAAGPVLLGSVKESTGGWPSVIVLCIGVSLAMALCGSRAGADRPLGVHTTR